jgi:hypothetical protein
MKQKCVHGNSIDSLKRSLKSLVDEWIGLCRFLAFACWTLTSSNVGWGTFSIPLGDTYVCSVYLTQASESNSNVPTISLGRTCTKWGPFLHHEFFTPSSEVCLPPPGCWPPGGELCLLWVNFVFYGWSYILGVNFVSYGWSYVLGVNFVSIGVKLSPTGGICLLWVKLFPRGENPLLSIRSFKGNRVFTPLGCSP